MICAIDFLAFQMLVLIDADSFFITNSKFVWKNQVICYLESGNPEKKCGWFVSWLFGWGQP
jgi:hypothetical protein